MSSSSLSSSSVGKRTAAKPLCFCDVEANLRYSNTKANPGRPFLGCSKYNTKGLPHCNYFKWVDSEQDIKLEERKNLVSRKTEEELQKRLSDIENKVTELLKIVDDIKKIELVLYSISEEIRKKESVLLEREAALRRSRMLSRLYFGVFVIIFCYLYLW
ncbi:hypothetical protein F2P56_003224 [Juglans regia]|uniref:Uncharacterized protein LOC108986479 n=2 Tax=Juglans regia TaxID=51240 RepID=A0A2I4E5H6_JUGRE|nr:uncharacterized protein LOC108986479 [Juglans regia]XP_035543182.1 uncharacterized protein LOC118347626 [Juglans regia]XP_035546359.1 uncharacterized protein LOC118348531 [Juglans regia]KAF5468060.1 hypothetical protein F2P56_012242 [Juglans regia]KAF5476472.1 hypothetical protein F2P56_003224 [Juglans regia]